MEEAQRRPLQVRRVWSKVNTQKHLYKEDIHYIWNKTMLFGPLLHVKYRVARNKYTNYVYKKQKPILMKSPCGKFKANHRGAVYFIIGHWAPECWRGPGNITGAGAPLLDNTVHRSKHAPWHLSPSCFSMFQTNPNYLTGTSRPELRLCYAQIISNMCILCV